MSSDGRHPENQELRIRLSRFGQSAEKFSRPLPPDRRRRFGGGGIPTPDEKKQRQAVDQVSGRGRKERDPLPPELRRYRSEHLGFRIRGQCRRRGAELREGSRRPAYFRQHLAARWENRLSLPQQGRTP